MKNVMFTVMLASFLIVGCGNVTQPTSSSGVSKPPQASVSIGSQQIQTVVNGYQWSDGNHSSVADAVSDPAKNLQNYVASVGAKVTLSSDQVPKSMELTMWSNGAQVSKRSLNGTSFTLPVEAGDYTYEITGHWGHNYVNYDFEVQVKGLKSSAPVTWHAIGNSYFLIQGEIVGIHIDAPYTLKLHIKSISVPGPLRTPSPKVPYQVGETVDIQFNHPFATLGPMKPKLGIHVIVGVRQYTAGANQPPFWGSNAGQYFYEKHGQFYGCNGVPLGIPLFERRT